MIFEIVLYSKARWAGRVRIGDGEIFKVMENGIERDLKDGPDSKSLNAALKHIQYKTDLEPVGEPELIDGKSRAWRTHRYRS